MPAPKIIYQDKTILVINKPSGLVVNRAESVKTSTLQDWVEENIQINKYSNKQVFKYKDFINRSGIVHRLDKDTSGLLVIAKTFPAFKALQKQFKDRLVRKKYLSLVHGKIEPKIGDIKMPIARNPKNKTKFSVYLKGKKSTTYYKQIEYFSRPFKKNNFYSLVELSPKTGRTHQLRVHLKHLGHPIVADPIYLGKKQLKEDLSWCPRLFLHAKSLSFFHPQTKLWQSFESPVPKALLLVLAALRKENI